jgi:hypothetical protein
MTHLDDLELLAALDDSAVADPAGHLHTCRVCQEKLAALRDTHAMVAAVDVPEPSPMFWDHFSERVRTGVRDVEPERTWWREQFFGLRLDVALGALVLCLAIGGFVWRMNTQAIPEGPSNGVATSAQHRAAEPAAVAAETITADDDAAWALVRSVADDLSLDDTMAAGLAAAPGSADVAALGLTAEERTELVRLLEAEMKRHEPRKG